MSRIVHMDGIPSSVIVCYLGEVWSRALAHSDQGVFGYCSEMRCIVVFAASDWPCASWQRASATWTCAASRWSGVASRKDCAAAALYLCSDASRAVTGIVLPVDAGWCVSG